MIRTKIRRHIPTKWNFRHDFGHFAIRQDVGIKIGSSRKKWKNSFLSLCVEGSLAFVELLRGWAGARRECVLLVEVRLCLFLIQLRLC